MAAALTGLNTFWGIFLNFAELRKVAALAGLNMFRVFFKSSAKLRKVATVSFSDDEFVIGPCRSTATHDNDRK